MEFETWVVMLAGQELFLGQRNLAGSLNFENPPSGCWEHLHDCAIGSGFDSAFWWQRKELQTRSTKMSSMPWRPLLVAPFWSVQTTVSCLRSLWWLVEIAE